MNYAILIIVAIAGIALGMYIARRKGSSAFIAKQMEQKAENKQKILEFVQAKRKNQKQRCGKTGRSIQRNRRTILG